MSKENIDVPLDIEAPDEEKKPKSKKKKEFDVHNMTPDEQLKFEIAQELGLDEKVLQKGWKSLTSKESGRIGGMITGRKRQLKEEALKGS